MSDAPHPKTTPEAMREIHDSIYREKVLRARAMTPEERCSDVFELSTFQFEILLAGALHRIKSTDRAAGWREVARQLERLNKARDHKFYTTAKPSDS